MINSFLNLCRACPMPTYDKFTEYKTNYKWYENYSSSSNEQNSASFKPTDLTAVTCEPAIPRRRKHPDAAYRSNHSVYHVDPAIVAERARSKEKSMANSRSRSADPNMGRKSLVINPISEYEVPYQRCKKSSTNEQLMIQSFPPPAPSSSSHHHHRRHHFRSRTEYRSQYDWPGRKSISLNVIKGGENKSGIITEQPKLSKNGKVTEYKAKFRPFSAYEYVDGGWKEPILTTVVLDQSSNDSRSWYQEVVDTRKKAEENRSRSRYSALESDHFEELYKRQVALWSQVSSRYMLSALSLASSQHKEKNVRTKSRKPTAEANISRKSSQSPQKSPQKRLVSSSDSSRARKASPRTLPNKQQSPSANSSVPNYLKLHSSHSSSPAAISSTKNRSRSAHSSDTTSPVKSDGSSRIRSPKKSYTKPNVPHSSSSLPKQSPKTKKLDDKLSNRPTTLVTPPKSKSASSRGNDNIPKIHSKSKPKSTPSASGMPANDNPGKIWLKPEKKKDSPNIPDETSANSMTPEASKNDDCLANSDKQPPNHLENSVIGEDKVPCEIINGVPTPNTDSPPPLPEPEIVPGGPVTLTHVRSPEELTGVKSPDPETWTVPLLKSQPLHWMDGQIESPMSDSGKTSSTPASQNSPHHLAQKPKPASEIHKLIPNQNINDGNSGGLPSVCSERSQPMKASAKNPEEVLDKARNRLDEFWNSSD